MADSAIPNTIEINVSTSDGQHQFNTSRYVGGSLEEFAQLFGESETLILAQRMLTTDIQNKVRAIMNKKRETGTAEEYQKLVDEHKPSDGIRRPDPEKLEKQFEALIDAIKSGKATPAMKAQLAALAAE